MSKDDLRALLERVRTAEGPDREIDCTLHAALDGRTLRWDGNMLLGRHSNPPHDECVVGTIDPGRRSRNFTEGYHKPPVPTYTASVEAAYALVERYYPKCAFELAYGPKNAREDYEALCRLWPSNETSFWDQPKKPHAATPALAICLALIHALIGKEPKQPRKKSALTAQETSDV